MKKLILFSLILTSCLTTNSHKKNHELKSYGTAFKMPSCLASVKNHKTDSSLTFFLKQKSNKISTILDEDYFLIPCDDVANFAAIEYNEKKIILYNELFFLIISKIINIGKNVYEDAWEHPAIKFILFHEMGHIENSNCVISNGMLKSNYLTLEDKINAEIEADKFASLNMYKIGFSEKDVIFFFSQINSYFILFERDELNYDTHPDYNERTINFKKTYSQYKNEKYKTK